MLYQILEILEQAEQPLSLAELSQRLQIEPSALEGMIAFWVRKGRLRDTAVLGCGGAGRLHVPRLSAGVPVPQRRPAHDHVDRLNPSPITSSTSPTITKAAGSTVLMIFLSAPISVRATTQSNTARVIPV